MWLLQWFFSNHWNKWFFSTLDFYRFPLDSLNSSLSLHIDAKFWNPAEQSPPLCRQHEMIDISKMFKRRISAAQLGIRDLLQIKLDWHLVLFNMYQAFMKSFITLFFVWLTVGLAKSSGDRRYGNLTNYIEKLTQDLGVFQEENVRFVFDQGTLKAIVFV